MMLNFFANVAPNVIPVSDDKVDLEFTVEEKPAGQASANMGYSQYYGLTGGGGLSLPNFRAKVRVLHLVIMRVSVREARIHMCIRGSMLTGPRIEGFQ